MDGFPSTLPTPRFLKTTGGPILRWGILAPGEIAAAFTHTLHANTDQRVVAVASRIDEAHRQVGAQARGARSAAKSKDALANVDN